MKQLKNSYDDILCILNLHLEEKTAQRNAYILVCKNNGGYIHEDVVERYDGDIKRIESNIEWFKQYYREKVKI